MKLNGTITKHEPRNRGQALNKKILIVRGDEDGAKALSFLLAGAGCRISAHTKATQALEAAKHERFDLAITDRELPENKKDFELIANLKESQPSLPVLLLSEEKELDDIINCIRVGVSDIIDQPTDLRSVFETTRQFLRDDTDSNGNDVSWEDLMEVESVLASMFRPDDDQAENSGSTVQIDSEEIEAIRQELEEAIAEREKISGELSETKDQLKKAQKFVDEVKESGQAVSGDYLEKTAELDEKEAQLNDLSERISKQKVEVETQLAELDAERIEFEELKQSGDGGESVLSTEERLDLEAQIQDLEHKLASMKASSGNSEKLEKDLLKLRQELQEAKELNIEKDFIIEQRNKELEKVGHEKDEVAANSLEVEKLEEEKRLLEVEKFKLQEKLNDIEREQHELVEQQGKMEREINVEKRDAELSLREMQAQIKEEQLKLQVQQAQFQEEMRQFEQAKQNFQEDIEDLQSRQKELSKLEKSLERMKQDIEKEVSSSALPSSSKEAKKSVAKKTAKKEEKPAEDAEEQELEASEDKTKPDTWTKPPEAKKSGRGPLRIGRKSSF